ncbi:putative phage tail protein [Allisonella histaminiformans]|uniref:putative phage tail protein n=1 Tax=Allisonella histaminiformans TaxID=209880 RepID=UPI002E77C03B|nr:putative phage tail protein [Allisonella histaminiformans]
MTHEWTHEWMRQKVVDILYYLPQFLQKSPLFKGTNDADSKEHETIRLDLQDLLDQFFIESASWGLEQWEDLVNIKTNTTKSLESRRDAVIAKLRKPASVTETFLTNLINRYIADKAGYIISYPSEYRIEILYHGGQILDYNSLRKSINTYIPAHIGYKLVTITNGELTVYGAGTVQLARETIIDMSTKYEITIDDSALNEAGAVIHNYKLLPLSGGK